WSAGADRGIRECSGWPYASVNACKSRGWWDAEMIISLPSVRHLYSFMSFSSEIFFNIYF
ncbi:hypothetical protein AAIG91_35690, partial [Pseudomonas aeruginosa]|uniref:hypothetical protein n=1 Tax=Pseudomonas aeruginosa TaxID=287 RepID=UPI0031B6B217